MKIDRRTLLASSAGFLISCTGRNSERSEIPKIYESYDPKFWDLIDRSQGFETLGSGYGWAEGPTWDPNTQSLYFTDVPGNIAYKWNSQSGVTEFLNPSGSSLTDGFREAGANGLLYDHAGQILMCNHGKRALQLVDLKTLERTDLASHYNGKKFNSPNDLIKDNHGTIYFTDPPYGLEGLNLSALKELDFNGVYKLQPNSTIYLLVKELTYPNGVALSPDQKYLYITQSDPEAPFLFRLDLNNPDLTLEPWIDFSKYLLPNFPGLPDGMVVDEKGNIFVTGPGGIFIAQADGTLLGRILTGKASANCTFGEDGHTLFVTNHDRLLKLRTKTKGLQRPA